MSEQLSGKWWLIPFSAHQTKSVVVKLQQTVDHFSCSQFVVNVTTVSSIVFSVHYPRPFLHSIPRRSDAKADIVFVDDDKFETGLETVSERLGNDSSAVQVTKSYQRLSVDFDDCLTDRQLSAVARRTVQLTHDNNKDNSTRQEKPSNCGTKAADVLDKIFSRQTLMRIHWICWCFSNYCDFTTPVNSKCCSICHRLAVI